MTNPFLQLSNQGNSSVLPNNANPTAMMGGQMGIGASMMNPMQKKQSSPNIANFEKTLTLLASNGINNHPQSKQIASLASQLLSLLVPQAQ